MESKRHRRKTKHTLMVVSNKIDGKVHQYNLSVIVSLVIVIVLIFCTGTAALCFYVDGVSLTSVSKSKSALEDKISTLEESNRLLTDENKDLTEKNSILGVALDEKIKAEQAREEEEAKLYIPSGLPASKVLSMKENGGNGESTGVSAEATQNSEGETIISEEVANEIISAQSNAPIIEFDLQNGSEVMAAANGTVIMVADDTEYTHVVRIDHGNGYVTIYRCNLTVKVAEGAIVEKGDALFQDATENVTLGYQVLYNAEYINPSDIMELKG